MTISYLLVINQIEMNKDWVPSEVNFVIGHWSSVTFLLYVFMYNFFFGI